MDVLNLAELLLSPDEKNELHSSMELLEQSNHSAFYEKNQSIIQSILFLETLEEFLDFSKENELDAECFCAAFLCAHGYGIQIGGYEDDLTHILTEFFHTQGMEYPEISEIVHKEKIYTDCSDYDNFKKSMTAINQVLDAHGMRLIVLEDYIYCDCEYTVLRVDKTLAENVLSTWSSDNFEIYLRRSNFQNPGRNTAGA